MNSAARRRLSRTTSVAVLAMSAAFLAACGTSSKSMAPTKKRSSEYFAESEYGVKASPRVTSKRSNLPRGGGRDQLGKPYKVKGKWYYPKEDRNYAKVGAASWYGDAFHGRLTANGEIYDMTHLTAAHPTMPLPSYARVTNTANGSSVIVRVNDRGPYAHGRVIDLSKRAAELLDYHHVGVAKVKVEYVGRAPLDGQDDRYLVASYRPGKNAPDPSDGLPSGVMIAMNGTTPSAVASSPPFPGVLTVAANVPTAGSMTETLAGNTVVLPESVPIAPERPAEFGSTPTQTAFAVMSYADERIAKASDPFALIERKSMTDAEIVASWKRNRGREAPAGTSYVAVGTFGSSTEAERVASAFAGLARVEIEKSEDNGVTWYALSAYPTDTRASDTVLRAAWAAGAVDAMAVRE